MRESYWQIFDRIHAGLASYYFRWYFDRPMVITGKRDEELHEVQRILARGLHFYAEHYPEYLEIVPYRRRVLDILAMTQGREYHLGTFRPDYIITETNEIHICEITSRFFGNGYFLSFFADKRGCELAAASGISPEDTRMEDMLAYFAHLPEGHDRIAVLKSADRSDSIKLYVPFYRELGFRVDVWEAEELIAGEREIPRDAFILSALNQNDLEKMPDRVLRQMCEQDGCNDFRTVFLAHDKRVLALFHEDAFTDRFLSARETAFIRSHLIPTALSGRSSEIWEDARRNKDRYILKHCRLGKSEKVYAGVLTAPEVWEALWQTGATEEMILQPFLSQRKHPNEWEGRAYTEYISGTILCIDDLYFGTGLFRSSSLPVLNLGDDRKVSYVLTDHPEAFRGRCILL